MDHGIASKSGRLVSNHQALCFGEGGIKAAAGAGPNDRSDMTG